MNHAKENTMATLPVEKLMMKMGVPMILSMMLQAFYNIVDSAFIANMAENGEAALNALTLAFPVQMLMVGIPIGTGVGMNALIARNLGEGKNRDASIAAGNAEFLGALIYGAFLLFGIFGSGSYIASQTANPLIRTLGSSYLQICCCASVGIVYFAIFEKLLQATGRAKYSTIAQISGAVTNIVLDPIMIYGLLGFPTLGVRGAAYATVIGQCVSASVGLFFHLRKNTEIENRLSFWKPKRDVILRIYSIGVPAIIGQAMMSVMTYGLNLVLRGIDPELGENVVTAYGLYYKVQQFILFAAFGLRDAITPIVSFSYGMGDPKRIKKGVRTGLLYTLTIMLIGLAVVELFAVPFVNAFALSGLTEGFCLSAMRIISLSFPLAGICIAFQGVFQALGGGLETLIVSLLRQVILVLPVAYGFSLIARQNIDAVPLVFCTFLLAEGASAVVAILLYRRKRRKLKLAA